VVSEWFRDFSEPSFLPLIVSFVLRAFLAIPLLDSGLCCRFGLVYLVSPAKQISSCIAQFSVFVLRALFCLAAVHSPPPPPRAASCLLHSFRIFIRLPVHTFPPLCSCELHLRAFPSFLVASASFLHSVLSGKIVLVINGFWPVSESFLLTFIELLISMIAHLGPDLY
jgi:hypothetical protein